MALFRRRSRDSREGIAAFWAWWDRAKDDVDTLLAREELHREHRLHRRISHRVAAIHPELTWELTTGQRAHHALILSPEGSPALRPTTERWLRAGPGADERWEYHPVRPPNPRAYLGETDLNGWRFRPGAARFGAEADTERARLHVAIWHPDFGHIDDATRLQAAFLLLDWALGEDDVERWLGEVRVIGVEPDLDVVGLRAAVAELATAFTSETWIAMEGIDDQNNPVAMELRVPLPRLDYPLFDLHGVIAVRFQPGSQGWPDPEEAASLEAMGKGLTGRLGSSAVLVATVTLPGIRMFHLYVDGVGVVPEQVAAWAAQQDRPMNTQWTSDPGWEIIRGLY